MGPRTLTLPAGFSLSEREITTVLLAADARKREGVEPTFVEAGGFVEVKMPVVGTSIALEDLRSAITRLNHAAEYGHADVQFSFHDGRLVKRGWILLKDAREDRPPTALTLGGQRRKEF